MNDLWLVSFLISTFFSFFTIAFVVEIAISLFRIKKHRTRSILRLSPMVGLAMDFFSAKLSTGNLLNPLHCESCIQKFFLYFVPELKEYLTQNKIAWSRHLASQMPDFLFTMFFLSFGIISMIIYLRKIVQILLLNRCLYTLIKRGEPCPREIENKSLSDALKKQKAQILVSDCARSPMAAYWKTILIPRHLVKQLSQDAFEAIISHELEHLRWKDPISKFFFEIGSTLFWWVPTRWWLNKVDQDQELSADASITRYSIDGAALAAALVTIGKQRCKEPVSFCAFAIGKGKFLLARLRLTLDPSATALQKNLLMCSLIGIAVGSLIILSCMM